LIGTTAISQSLLAHLSVSKSAFKLSYPSSAQKSITFPFSNLSQNLLIIFPLCSRGSVDEIIPSTSYLCGAEKTSSVGKLGQKLIPSRVVVFPAHIQRCPLGNQTIKSVFSPW